MSRYSLPIKRLDGSVVVEPLHTMPTGYIGHRRPVRRRFASFNNITVKREKIFRDIAILVLLAVTIIAGSAVLIGTIWRDVAVAESEARIVEAEQKAAVEMANARLAEAKIQAAADERWVEENLPLILAGFGIGIIVLLLARPQIIVGR